MRAPIRISHCIPRPLQAAVYDLYYLAFSPVVYAESTAEQERALLELLSIPKLVLRQKGPHSGGHGRDKLSFSMGERIHTAAQGLYDDLFMEEISLFGTDPSPSSCS